VDYALLDEDETFLTPAQLKKKKIMKMKMKKTIDVKVGQAKKMKLLDDGTEVTDNEDEGQEEVPEDDDYDQEYDEEDLEEE
jgi:hypothetical protein